MKVVRATTVDRGLQAILTEMNKPGNSIDTQSRNGPVRRIRGASTITWTRPMYRVSFDPIRNANPAFHLFESLWMLAGHNDVKRPEYFASQMGQFSDDGVTFHGAYGHRWVKHFEMDQLRDYVIPSLIANKDDRRVVLGMWDAASDIDAAKNGGKDVPCNLICVFDAAQQDGKLHIVVFNRSNDQVWGATGANAVQFSMLQEYVASAVGLNVGTYEQVSVNSHLYLELNEVSKKMLEAHTNDPNRELPYFGMLSPLRGKDEFDRSSQWQIVFDEDLNVLMNNYDNVLSETFNTRFFRQVVKPVIGAYNLYKKDRLEAALGVLTTNIAPLDWMSPWYRWHDWNIAMYEWIQRICSRRNPKISELIAASEEEFIAGVKKIWHNSTVDGDVIEEPWCGEVATIRPSRTIMPRGVINTEPRWKA